MTINSRSFARYRLVLGFAPLIIVIVLALIGVAGYIVFRSTTVPSPTSSPTQSPTPTPDETASQAPNGDLTNWKTYNNLLHLYTLKIPNDWEIKEGKYAFLNIPGEVVFLPPSEKSKPVFQTEMAITVMTNQMIRYSLDTEKEYQEWLKKNAETGVGERLYKTGILKVGGENAVQFVSRTLPGDPTETFYSFVTWFRKNGMNYYIELGGDEKIVKDNLITYNQILSTFKFIPTTITSTDYDQAIGLLEVIPEIQIIQKSVIKAGRKTFFTPGNVNGDVVKIWLYEGGFPDQHTTRIDTFNVNIKTKVITVDDVAMISGQEFITLDEWRKTVKERFE